MIIEGIGNATFVNGVLRIQTLAVNPAGNVAESGVVEIPGNKIAEVINLLATAAQGISDKIESNSDKPKSEAKEKKINKKTKKK
jgi:hypothetical protein